MAAPSPRRCSVPAACRAGDVVGDGGVQAEGEIRLDLERGGLGAAQADFLLHGENGVKIVGGLGLPLFQARRVSMSTKTEARLSSDFTFTQSPSSMSGEWRVTKSPTATSFSTSFFGRPVSMK
jgi:hypothetical protein